MLVRLACQLGILFSFLFHVYAYLSSSSIVTSHQKVSSSSSSLLFQKLCRKRQSFIQSPSFLKAHENHCRHTTCVVISSSHGNNEVDNEPLIQNNNNNAIEQTMITKEKATQQLITEDITNMLLEKKNQETIRSFIDQINQSIQDGTFASIILRGVSKQNNKKINNSVDDQQKDLQKQQQQSELRGCIRYVTGRLITLQQPPNRRKQNDDMDNLQSNSNQPRKKLHVTFKYYYATDIVKNWDIIGNNNNNTRNGSGATNDVTDGLGILLNVPPTHHPNKNNLVPVSEWNDDGTKNHHHNTIRSATLELIDGASVQLTMGSSPTNGATIPPPQFKIRKIKNKQQQEKYIQLGDGNNTDHVFEEDKSSNNNYNSHDRTKQFPVPLTEPLWRALGMMTLVSDDPNNRSRKLARNETEKNPTKSTSSPVLSSLVVKPAVGMSSKIKQCQKFVEIVDRLIEQRLSYDNSNNNKGDENNETKKPNISVVDMGCGRGYLTFALHSFLQTKYGSSTTRSTSTNQQQQQKWNDGVVVQSLGIDIRPKLVNEIDTIAQNLGLTDLRFANHTLRFETGTIEQYVSISDKPKVKNDPPDQAQHRLQVATPTPNDTKTLLNVLIALHACDTATDDAIWFGIHRQVDVIVVAPCCHKQIRPQVDTYMKHTINRQRRDDHDFHPMMDVLRHNIYRERMSETATDSIRALLLELSGYTVQVFEFIGGEHTSKNVMITGVLQPQSSRRSTEEQQQQQEKKIRERIRSLCTFYGIKNHKLAWWMNEALVDNCDDESTATTTNDDDDETYYAQQHDPSSLLTKQTTLLPLTLEQTQTRRSMLSNRIATNDSKQGPLSN